MPATPPEAKRIPVGITTSPRPRRFLIDTIRSVLASATTTVPEFIIAPNFADPGEDWATVRELIGPAGRVLDPLVPRTLREHVEAEDSLRDFRAGNNVYASEWGHRGIQKNSDRLYRELCGTGANCFVSMQDDVALCPRALDRIYHIAVTAVLRQRIPPIGAVSFYTPQGVASKHRLALWRYAGNMFYGELCLLWRRAAAEEFLRLSNHSNAHDLEIGRFFSLSRWRLYGHCPCLAQHVGLGDSSARGDPGVGHQRTTMNFNPGHDAVRDGRPWR